MHLTCSKSAIPGGHKRKREGNIIKTELVIPLAILFSGHVPQSEYEMAGGNLLFPPLPRGLKALYCEYLIALRVILVLPVLYVR